MITPTALADARIFGLAVLAALVLWGVRWLIRTVDTIDPEDGRDD